VAGSEAEEGEGGEAGMGGMVMVDMSYIRLCGQCGWRVHGCRHDYLKAASGSAGSMRFLQAITAGSVAP
jgi:hypothetical protein